MQKKIQSDAVLENVKAKAISDIRPPAIQRIKNQVAINLLREWMADDSGYDDKVWHTVKKSIEENRLSDRKRFDD